MELNCQYIQEQSAYKKKKEFALTITILVMLFFRCDFLLPLLSAVCVSPFPQLAPNPFFSSVV
jgi:hypothetical protein